MASAALGVVLLVSVPACGRGGAGSGASPSGVVGFVPVDPASPSPTDRAIASAQTTLRRDPGDFQALLDLDQAYLQKAREVADPSLYAKAAGITKLLAHRRPSDFGLLVTEGSLANALHRFADGLRFGRQAVRIAPDSPSGYGVVVDAANELGRYDEAIEATQKMADLRADLPALSRVSYAQELRGDLVSATTSMTEAVTAGGTAGGENVAYVQVLLGNLLLTTGHVAQAEGQFEAAEQAFPGYPAARAGRAAVMVAGGRPADAAALLSDVVRVQPLAAYAIAQGDDLTAAGQPAAAAQAYDLVGVIERLYAANGVNVDLELALFEADHHPGPDAVAQARKGLASRPSYLGHEVLAWALYRAGRVTEAGKEIQRALQVGNIDPQLRFHAAVIEDALGDVAAATRDLATVLAGNPRFSALYQDQLNGLAARLGLVVPPPATGTPTAPAS
ncbi:MAG TPA: tetratricopeptide repeat protein [Acidimicrobiales bacterium]|nr:tetratricopeptide repeat protein [Acidimicrobiales bacterium]